MMRMMRKTLILILVLVLHHNSFSQKVDRFNNLWFTTNLNIQLSTKWKLASEFHYRKTDWGSTKQQFLIRPKISYKVNSVLSLAAGYTYGKIHPYGDNGEVIATPEHNIWEQFSLSNRIGKTKLKHRFRLEHRSLGVVALNSNGSYRIQGFKRANRFRYRFTFVRPIAFKQKLRIKFFNELWINIGDKALPFDLNQNWLYGGLVLKPNNHFSLELGFMDQVLKYSNDLFERNPTIQGTFTLNI